jgi:hypothetical protein
MLNKLKENDEQRPRRVVIVGGSHSGFSSAWMLMNHPASHKHNASKTHIQRSHLVQKKSIKYCSECCKCVEKAKKIAAAPVPVKIIGGTFGTATRNAN